MTDSQSERLFNLFNRVTKETSDTIIDISTAVNIMNRVEPGINCKENALIGALNENNYKIVDTLLGHHRLMGIDIRQEYLQYLNYVDRSYRKLNQPLVPTFLYLEPVLKEVLDTHVVKAKSPNTTISKDAMVKILSGYGRKNSKAKYPLSNIYTDTQKFIYSMHQYFGVDLVEEDSQGKWYIRGWVAKYEYINGQPVERNWQKDALSIDDISAAIKYSLSDETVIEKPVVIEPMPKQASVTKSKVQVEEEYQYDVEQCIAMDTTTKSHEKTHLKTAYLFFKWMSENCRFTDNVESSIGEARLLKAFQFYASTTKRGAYITNSKISRLIKSMLALRRYEKEYKCQLPIIIKHISLDQDNKNPITLRWEMPQWLVKKIKAIKIDESDPDDCIEEKYDPVTNTPDVADDTPIVEEPVTAEAPIVMTTKIPETKPEPKPKFTNEEIQVKLDNIVGMIKLLGAKPVPLVGSDKFDVKPEVCVDLTSILAGIRAQRMNINIQEALEHKMITIDAIATYGNTASFDFDIRLSFTELANKFELVYIYSADGDGKYVIEFEHVEIPYIEMLLDKMATDLLDVIKFYVN